MNVNKIQKILEKVQGTTITEYGDLNASIYLQKIRDLLLGVTPTTKYGSENEKVYLQQIRNAILRIPDGPFGSLPNRVYLKQIRDAFAGTYNHSTDGAGANLNEDAYLDAILLVAAPRHTINGNQP